MENNDLKVFKEQEILGKHFRVFGTPEIPLFLAKDVAEWIEYDLSSVGKMLKTVDEDEKFKEILLVNTLSEQSSDGVGNQNVEAWFLTEDGMYEVLMQSRKPIAKQFKKQVKQILKDIRKYGMYMKDDLLNDPNLLEDVIHKYKEERQKRLEVEKQLEIQKPKVELYNQVMSSDGLMNFIEVANAFGECGRNTLMEKLRQKKVLLDSEVNWNKPSSRYAKHFKVVIRPRKTDEGVKEIPTTLCRPSALKIIKKVLDKEKDLLKQAN
jgi:anti-repressor protein